ncbi:glycoside hydrolase family 37 protein [Pluteus cervinus]|uniref:Glycoside hydrolase family 37 protein n=1 Tax=Pluteus cervinus TaxID=181527 RepID=A0ACD3B004_9AGAR|nr:glycoside hydrolase family 37 protein [Pluteus cervinus]
MLTALVTLACLLSPSLAQSSTATSPVQTATAVAADPNAVLPSQVADPPKQAWCPSDIFCAGPLLQTINIANLYSDDKTFVDKPTNRPASDVLSDFSKFNVTTVTEEQLVNFVDSDFSGEGLELEAIAIANFNSNPPFLNNVTDSLVRSWAQTVHGFWTQLIRTTNSSTLCGAGSDCESSLIPLNHTFVIPGGRFREQYYWDSFWIVEGLLESQLFDVAKDTLENFMDEISLFGFIPNGGRIYYLDRSQPPVFIQMLQRYVVVTGDTSVLTRGLPLAEVELAWWASNRQVQVTSPFTNQTHAMYHYAVVNSAPRPESYGDDYLTANNPATNPPLNESQRADLYAELASGAESGWDYTVRFFTNPTQNDGLLSLNVRGTIPVDLNSLLYRDHVLLAGLYGTSNATATDAHLAAAAALKSGILDLFWDNDKIAFYDFNLKTNSRNNFFSVAHFYPIWSGIIPDILLSSSDMAFAAFSSVNMVMNRYNGTFPSTFVISGQQWDAPNAWPPHQYIIIQALNQLPSNVTGGAIPTPPSGQSSFGLIPSGQLGLSEDQLPGQAVSVKNRQVVNATLTGPGADINTLSGTVVNGGNATSGEGWGAALQRQMANRYITSAFCSWHATGGSIPNVLPPLPNNQLNVTLSIGVGGNMFEKFSFADVDSAGSGGEYTVQAGFGWTNGVVLWVASNFGGVLNEPQCPNLLDSPLGGGGATSSASHGIVAPSTLFMTALACVAHLLF